eukprot:TRINITY_DN2441_c0_g2_i1.p1 TRINITY_DN2441_c0_g2~~TRINITY_DN2441_c0_g2_i1.p1  ORF type:complete len:225 (+),score=51.94 TRINITY_DN2441_c0_g2_i1:51-725(+)
MMMVLPPVFLGAFIFGRVLRKLSTRVTDLIAKTSETAEEKVSAIRTVKVFAKEEKEIKTYSDAVNEVFELASKVGLYQGMYFGVIFTAVNLSLLAVLYSGGMMIIDGTITAGDLTSFLFYSLYVAFAFSGIASFWTDLSKSLGSSQRVFELLDAKVNISGDKELEHIEGLIEFDNVVFKYPTRPNEIILNGLSVKIYPGESVAIVGHSGSGKSIILFSFSFINI